MKVKARYINPFGKVHTLTGSGGTKQSWSRWIKRSFGPKNIIWIKFSSTNEAFTET